MMYFNVGTCLDATEYGVKVSVKSKQDVAIYLVDPSVIFVDLTIMQGEKIRLIKDNGLYNTNSFRVSVQQSKSVTQNCAFYDSKNFYASCFAEMVKESIFTSIGCFPHHLALGYNWKPVCEDRAYSNVSKAMTEQLYYHWRNYTNAQYYYNQVNKSLCK